MKKAIVFIICMVMLLSCAAFTASADDGVLLLPTDDGSGYPVVGINDGYSNDDDVRVLVVPENITGIGDEAFIGCDALESITLHTGLQHIGRDAFTDTAFYNDAGNWQDGVLYIGDCLIRAEPSGIGDSITVRDGTRLIADGAFADCAGLSDITLPATVRFVGEDAFFGTPLYSDESRWENGILYIGNVAVAAEKEAVSLAVREGTRAVADSALEGCTALAEITLPSTLTDIGRDAFLNCRSLTSIALGAAVETVGRAPFVGCDALAKIDVDAENRYYTVSDGVLYNKRMTAVVRCPQALGGRLALAGGVTRINSHAFYGCARLGAVSIPGGCVFIGESAFYGCTSLGDIKLPDAAEYIDEYAFSHSGISSVKLPDSVTHLGKYAFSECTALESAALGQGVRELKEGVFEGCAALTDITLGSGVNAISSSAFSGSGYINSADSYTNGMLIASGRYLISVSPTLTHCDIPGGVTIIADGAFENGGALTRVDIPSSVASFDFNTFYDICETASVHYDGTYSSFYSKADFDPDRLDIYTTDFYTMILTAVIMLLALALTVVGFVFYDFAKKEDDEYDLEGE